MPAGLKTKASKISEKTTIVYVNSSRETVRESVASITDEKRNDPVANVDKFNIIQDLTPAGLTPITESSYEGVNPETDLESITEKSQAESHFNPVTLNSEPILSKTKREQDADISSSPPLGESNLPQKPLVDHNLLNNVSNPNVGVYGATNIFKNCKIHWEIPEKSKITESTYIVKGTVRLALKDSPIDSTITNCFQNTNIYGLSLELENAEDSLTNESTFSKISKNPIGSYEILENNILNFYNSSNYLIVPSKDTVNFIPIKGHPSFSGSNMKSKDKLDYWYKTFQCSTLNFKLHEPSFEIGPNNILIINHQFDIELSSYVNPETFLNNNYLEMFRFFSEVKFN
tara:strand:- start:515 stop:1549 length:1035 start_codon:yes stop_codon:yes gene_type:complete